MKNLNHNNPDEIKKKLNEIKNMAGKSAFDLESEQNIKVNIRPNESVGPAMFKADPLIPGGFMANSLTIRALRVNIFFLNETFEDLHTPHECACGKKLDLQFWKLCPYCGRDV